MAHTPLLLTETIDVGLLAIRNEAKQGCQIDATIILMTTGQNDGIIIVLFLFVYHLLPKRKIVGGYKMHLFAMISGRAIKAALVFTLALALLLPVSFSAAADDPGAGLQAGPINPAFLAYMESQSLRNDYLRGLNLQGIDTGGLDNLNFGYIPPMMDPGRVEQGDASQGLTEAASLPSTFDWRDYEKVTSVKDQGNAGTCWAFGNLATLESRVLIKDNLVNNFSELNLAAGIDESYVHYHANRSNAGGNSFMAADTLAKNGARDESVQPYGVPANANTTVNNAVYDGSTPPIQKVTDFRIVTDDGVSTSGITKIKNAIYQYGPVSAAFYYKSNVMTAAFIYDLPKSKDSPNHMITIVGWDDSIPHPSDGGKGAWIVKNSWGAAWGLSGYFYMCYGAANMTEIGSFHRADNAAGYEYYQPEEHLYFWDEAGYLLNLGDSDSPNSLDMRSVFTNESAGMLNAVNFWTTSNNATYQITIRNASDTALGAQSGTCQEYGYYSIPLTTPVPLAAGQQFKVDVRMTTPGYNYPLAISGRLNGYYNPDIVAGQSFYKPANSSTWVDTSSVNLGLSSTVTMYGLDIALGASVQEGVFTGSAASVSSRSATLTGILGSMDGASSVSVSFKYGVSPAMSQVTEPVVLSQPGPFTAQINGLDPNVTYYCQAKAQGDSTVYGGVQVFMTTVTPPALTTQAATSIGAYAAVFHGNLISIGDSSQVLVFFRYGTSTAYNKSSLTMIRVSPGDFTIPSTDPLTPDTTYHFQAIAVGNYNNASPVYGSDLIFKTSKEGIPAVSTASASDVSYTSATLKGSVTSTGSASTMTVYFQYGLDTAYGLTASAPALNDKGPFSADIANLEAATTYHYRAVGLGDYPGAVLIYGKDMTLKTKAYDAPKFSAPKVSGITYDSAIFASNLTNWGASNQVSVYFEYGLDKTTYGQQSSVLVLGQMGSFNIPVSGLTAGKTYYYHMATKGNYPNAGWVFTKQTSFKTKAYTLPSVSTSAAKNITKESATLNGKLSKVGSSNWVSVYFQYGTDQNYGKNTGTSSWNISGVPSAVIGDLEPGVKYSYRIVATGDYPGALPVYGKNTTFTTAKISPPGLSAPSAAVTSEQVTLKSKVSKIGSSLEGVDVHFEYWTAADSVHHLTPVQHLTAASSFQAVLNVADLQSGTTYSFCAVAAGDGTTTTAAKTFKTK
jgi:C1A family cysteine protease